MILPERYSLPLKLRYFSNAYNYSVKAQEFKSYTYMYFVLHFKSVIMTIYVKTINVDFNLS